MSLPDSLLDAGRRLASQCGTLSFSAPVWSVYHSLEYAWDGYAAYLNRFAGSPKRALFLGMNPGPWGMAQTGVPFGEIPAVRDWMGLHASIRKPAREHPKRPVEGFACTRSEVSGRRLWGLFAAFWGSADAFFADNLVLNYCPLAFLMESGANLTPDKLTAGERQPLLAACDAHLAEAIRLLDPEWLIGVGGFATRCLERVNGGQRRLGTLLHPSPASPAANRSWPEKPLAQLKALGLLPPP